MATIKSGTYRFNDVLTGPSANIEQAINFTLRVTVPSTDFDQDVSCYAIKVLSSMQMSYASSFAAESLGNEWVDITLGQSTDGSTYWNDFFGESIKIIAIPNDTEVSAEFYDWFNENAVERKTIVKAGTYTFNNLLNSCGLKNFTENIEFYNTVEYIITENEIPIVKEELGIDIPAGTYSCRRKCGGLRLSFTEDNRYKNWVDYINVTLESVQPDLSVFEGFLNTTTDSDIIYDSYEYPYDYYTDVDEFAFWNTQYERNLNIITIPNDTEVSNEFYIWFNANSNSNSNADGKLTKYEYITNLLPSVLVLTEVEKYAIQNNLYGNFAINRKNLFFYIDPDNTMNNSIKTNFHRALFKVSCSIWDENYIVVDGLSDDYEILYLDKNLNDISDKINVGVINIIDEYDFIYVAVITNSKDIYVNNLDVLDVDLTIAGVAF